MNLSEVLVNLGLKVGPQRLTDGTLNAMRAGKTGEGIVAQGHGFYNEAASRRSVFFNYAPAVAMSAPATAAIGNIVWNPPDSGVYLSLLTASLSFMADDADAAAINLCYSPQLTTPTTTSASTCGCTYLASGLTGQAKGYGIATIVTAAIPVFNISKASVAKLTLGIETHIVDFGGLFICPPGTLFSLHSIAAAAAGGVTSTLVWEEIPIL